jgi:hypothetical protein
MNPISFVQTLIFLAIGSFVMGFLMRRRNTHKREKRIMELENEMLSNHQEILRLEAALSKLNKNAESIETSPVINIESNDGISQKKAAH